jgi:hypothetical protein
MTSTRKAIVRIKIFILVILLFGDDLHGQWTDYGLWSSASISQEIFENFSYEAEAQARWDYDFSRLGSAFADIGISKSLSLFSQDIKVATTLRLGMSRTDNFLWEPIRRLSGSTRWKTDLSENLAFSCRLRYQSSLKAEGLNHAMRLRTGLHYKASKDFRAAVYTELFSRQRDLAWHYSDFRARIIFRIKTSKRRWASFGYQVEQQKNTTDPWTEHRLICSYDIEIKARKAEK